MTDKQLEALAIYRTHKHCQCQACELAREVLKEYDAGKCRAKAKEEPCKPTTATTVE
jgi:hypothetical protein